MLAHVGMYVCSRKWKWGHGTTVTVTAMTSRANGSKWYAGTVMGALTLRDGPIWWHYQSVSGIVNNMLAAATYLMLTVGGSRQVAGRSRGD
jgi:hypothetical protein